MIQWRDVPGYESAYQVSDDGQVSSLDRVVETRSRWGGRIERRFKGRAMKLFDHPAGYLSVRLRLAGSNRMHLVHRLVLLAFVGPCPKGKMTRHMDGDPANNRLANLRYGTSKQNQADRVRHGTHNRGENHPMSKLNGADIVAIRAATCPQQETADRFGVSFQTISKIISRQRWAHVKP